MPLPARPGKLAGKVAIVTGAGTGIGRAIALDFAAEGASLSLVGRRRAPLTSVAAEAMERYVGGGFDAKVLVQDGDISRESDCEKIVTRTLEGFGRIDILVNNAGVYAGKDLLATDLATWNEQIAVNLTGCYLMMRTALPHLIETRGNIVNISSTCGIRPLANASAYSAAKAGMGSLTQTAALEYAPKGVRVNCVAPGVVETPIHGLNSTGDFAAFRKNMGALHPLGRVGVPEDVSKAALYLASDDAAWVTGAILPVDGGIALT